MSRYTDRSGTYADVRKQVRKALPYSITEIGGKAEHAKWKEQEAIEAAQRLLESDARNAVKLEKAMTAFLQTPGVPKADVVGMSSPPIPSLKDKLLNVCANIWRNAFDPERK